MINHLTEKLFRECGLFCPPILRDTDGPGTGNSAIVERVERPKSGGVYLYLLKYKYPYKGNPFQDTVTDIHLVKKIIHYAIKSVAVIDKKTKICLALLFILPKWLVGGIRELVIDYFYGIIEWKLYPILLKPERYCTSIRELYRAFSVVIEKQKNKTVRKLLILARDILCMFIEHDSAYKFRLQDIVCETRKEELLANPKKEIDRLFGILLEREVGNVDMVNGNTIMGVKWGKIRKQVRALFIFPLFKKLVREVIQELDFEKLIPDEADKYYTLLRMDYNFQGRELEERIVERKYIEGENWVYFEELANRFLIDRDKFRDQFKNWKLT